MNQNSFIQNFKSFILNERLWSANQRILVAVSGGMDSVVLCELIAQCKYAFGIIHCNFKLRGADSDGDEIFVKLLGEKYGVTVYSKQFDTLLYKEENKLSLEEAARDLRYLYFEEIRHQHQFDKIATAHHINDNIETVLFKIIKGTGIQGLTGIPVKHGNIIRPLLFAEKQDIEKFAAENNLEYRTDSSNSDNNFDRNKIRNTIIPALKTINPALESTLNNNIKHFNDIAIIYKEQITKKLKTISFQKADDTYLPIARFVHLKGATTYLFEFLHPYGFNSAQITQIFNTLGETGKVFLSQDYRVILDTKHLILTNQKQLFNSYTVITNDIKTIRFSNYTLKLETNNYLNTVKFNTTGSVAYFDADLIQYPLTLRKWERGDYLYPLGLKRKKSDKPGKKKVSDILTDAKLNILQKENTWVLLSGEKIIWVVGLRQDGRLQITDKTKNLLKIKMLPQ